MYDDEEEEDNIENGEKKGCLEPLIT